MIEKKDGFFVRGDSEERESKKINVDELRQKLETALSHLEQPLTDFLLLFHPGCGGVINGSLGKYQCQECGGVFVMAELRRLVAM